MDKIFEPESKPAPLGRLDFLLLFLSLLSGFSLRLYIAIAAFATSFDSATVGVMAMRILEGDRPLFFYGQTYMGALEGYTAALMFALFGVSTTALAMAPILFALGWIAAMYFLFREIFDGRRGAAFAAAMSVAVTSVNGLWYTLASYGGYPEYLCFGTLFLWLSIRLAMHTMSRRQVWLHALLLGLTAALACWTNLQSSAYLLTGALLLAGVWVKRRSSSGMVGPFIFAAGIALTGLIPSLVVRSQMTPVAPMHLELSPTLTRVAWKNFVRLFPTHVVSPDAERLVQMQVLAMLLIALIHYIAAIVLAKSGTARFKRLIPVLLSAVFLCLYLMHPLSRANTPRYLLPMFTMLYAAVLSAGFALPQRLLRVTALIPLLAMTYFQTRAAFDYVNIERPKKAAVVREMNATSTAVQQLAIKHVYIVGNEIDGHIGQEYTFFARDRVKFVSLFSNREVSDETTAESDARPGYLVQRWHTERIRSALHAAGVEDFKIKQIGRDLFYDVRPGLHAMQSVRPRQVSLDIEGDVTGTAGSLFDRNADTGLFFNWSDATQSTAVVTMDLGESRPIGGLDIEDFSNVGLMRSFAIDVSDDGTTYTPLVHPAEQLSVYACGNKVYMLGYNCHWQLRFGPAQARFVRVRLDMGNNPKKSWFPREMYVLTDAGLNPQVGHDEVKAIRAEADDLRLKTLAADRWITYQLGFRSHGFSLDGLFPYPNHRYRITQPDRQIPCRRDVGFVVSHALADEAQAVLHRARAPELTLQRSDYDHYSLFYWKGKQAAPEAAPTLQWSGLMPLAGTNKWW